jgi:hypothetical protein
VTEFDWNRLRVGDRVAICEHHVDHDRRPSWGTVAFVNGILGTTRSACAAATTADACTGRRDSNYERQTDAPAP